MKISFRAFLHRIVTYSILLPFMPLYKVVADKKPILDAFYFVRGLPHGYIEGGVRVALYNSFEIAFPFNEDPSFDDVWLRDVYYPYEPKSDDVVIDVGAHMGFFTLKIAKDVKKVVAVEPDPVNFKFLAFNVRLNNVEDRVILHNLALGERDGQAFLDRSGYGFGRSKITTGKTDYLTKIKTVDNLISEDGLERVDLIKIDTEGSELEILEGAKETLQGYKPDLLLAAYHFNQEHLTLADYLRKYGYNIFCYRVPLFLSSSKEVYLHAQSKLQLPKIHC